MSARGVLVTNTPDAVRRPLRWRRSRILALAGKLLIKDRLTRDNPGMSAPVTWARA
jgi:hypothetical protein